ncbi:MAG: SGNH/GDSL hydrolase family protein [Candidatus Glassbacteria bacterium]
MKLTGAVTLIVLAVQPLAVQTAGQRAQRLAGAALKIVRIERRAHAAGAELEGEARAADSLFSRMVTSYEGGRIAEYVKSGSGEWGADIEKFLGLTEGLAQIQVADDPAALLLPLLREGGQLSEAGEGLLEGYGAAFLLVLDGRRELRLRLGIVEHMLEMGAPVSLGELGLSRGDTLRVKEIADRAASRARERGLDYAAEDIYLAMIRLDDLAGRFGRQQNEGDLADRLMATAEFSRIRGKLEKLKPLTLCFFGDSQTDNRHWSSPAHYPKIIEEVFRRINPTVKVVNAGVGGDDSREGLARIEKDVLFSRPDYCFVLFGGNDCAYWGSDHPAVQPEKFRANLDEISARLAAAGCRPVLLTYPQTPDFGAAEHETLRQMNRMLSLVRDAHGTGWIDMAREIDGRDSRRMYAVDAIHLSPDAHLLMVRIILGYLTDNPGALGP